MKLELSVEQYCLLAHVVAEAVRKAHGDLNDAKHSETLQRRKKRHAELQALSNMLALMPR